jgi:hypothetical protein
LGGSGYSTIVGAQFNCICANAGVYNTIIGGIQHIVCGAYSNSNATAGGLYAKHTSGSYNFMLSPHHGYITGINYSSIATTFYGAIDTSASQHLNTTVGGTYNLGFATTKFSNLYKNTNLFKINHPDPSKPHLMLFHSNVEAPTEGDTLYRYDINTCNCFAEITLPDYFKHLNKNPQVWITPNDSFGNAYGIIDQNLSKVTICSDTDGNFSALILGTRKDCLATKSWCGVERYKPIQTEFK